MHKNTEKESKAIQIIQRLKTEQVNALGQSFKDNNRTDTNTDSMKNKTDIRTERERSIDSVFAPHFENHCTRWLEHSFQTFFFAALKQLKLGCVWYDSMRYSSSELHMMSDEHSRVSGREHVVSLLAKSFLCSDLAPSHPRSRGI